MPLFSSSECSEPRNWSSRARLRVLRRRSVAGLDVEPSAVSCGGDVADVLVVELEEPVDNPGIALGLSAVFDKMWFLTTGTVTTNKSRSLAVKSVVGFLDTQKVSSSAEFRSLPQILFPQLSLKILLKASSTWLCPILEASGYFGPFPTRLCGRTAPVSRFGYVREDQNAEYHLWI